MLNLRKTEAIELAGEGETKYRFTFSRFSSIDAQRHTFRRDVAKRYVMEQAGISAEEFNKTVTNGVKLFQISNSGNTDEYLRQFFAFGWDETKASVYRATLSAYSWCRIVSSLTRIEVSEDGESWQDEPMPEDWKTPEGFLTSLDQAQVDLLDNVAFSINRSLLGFSSDSEDDKKKESVSTSSSATASTTSPKASTTAKTKISSKRQKKSSGS